MDKLYWRITLFLSFFLLNIASLFAGDSPCGATPLANNMTSFQTFNNSGNSDSGIPDPGCGSYSGSDIWFSVSVPPSGMLDIATLAGGMSNAAMAIYEGPCSNPNLISCTEDDNCGNTIMPIMNLTGLPGGSTIYIRIWAEGGGPNGTFEIRISDGPITAPPVPTTSTVGSAQVSGDCIQLTTTGPGQSACAWDPSQIDLNLPFDETFNFNFGNSDAGADGITWVFQNNASGLNTCGGTGGSIASNFTNSFIVEFDTWDNGAGASDIPNDHVAVHANGDQSVAINGPYDLGNIEDGQDHEIRFVWDPVTNGYEIYFDGGLTLSGNYDIINNCLGGSSNCYWGFTASTGGAVNNQSVCPVTAPEFPAGDVSTVDVEICEGESYFAGGANQTTSGFYTDITPLPNGCSSILNTNLTVNPASYFSYDAAVCAGFCEMVGNQQFCTTGIHEVTLNDQAANGCDSIVTLNLTVLNPIAVAFQPAPITCFNTSVLIDATPSTAGPGVVSYTWTGPSPDCFISGQNTTNPLVNCPGMYTMTLVQILGDAVCPAIPVTVEVIDGAILPTVEAGDNQNFDCTSSCVTLSSLGSDSGADISLTWTGPNGFSSNEPNPEVCEPGLYTLSLLNLATGCLNSDFVTVTGNSNPPNIEAAISGMLTCNETAVTIDGSASTGTGNLNFEWFDQNNVSIGITSEIDVTQFGVYTLVITDDDNGCTADTMIIVTENTNEPTAIATASDVLDCSDDPITIDGSFSFGVGTLSYEWQNVSGDSLGEGPTNEVTEAGVYILVITDSDNGCTASTSVQVTQSITVPTIDAAVSGLITCQDMEATLDGTSSSGIGTISYEWFDADGNLIAITETINVSDIGMYTLIITDSDNGCTATTMIEVDENMDAPDPVASVDGVLTCQDINATLDGTGSSGTGTITYEWFDATDASLGTNPTIEVSNTDIYTLIITDGANGCTASTTINATENIVEPSPDISVDGQLTCADLEVELDGSASTGIGTISYEWFDVDGNSIGTEVTVEVSTTDTYTLVITDDGNGCTAETTFNPTEDVAEPTPVATVDETLTCIIMEVPLDGSTSSGVGTISYEWFDADGNSIGMEETVDVLNTDTYTLVITDDANGCTAETTINAAEDMSAPTSNAGDNAFITCSDSETILDGSNSSSGSEISYEWINEGGVTVGEDVMVTVTETGNYTLIVTNGTNGCTAESMVQVDPDADLPTANAGDGASLTCVVDEVNLDGSDSSSGGNISYEWFDPNDVTLGGDLSIDVMAAGTYVLVVTNTDNGCTATSSVEVEEDMNAPTADAGDNAFLTCSDTEVTLSGGNSIGNDLAFEWFDEDGISISVEEEIVVEETAEYTLVVTDQENGCTAMTIVNVLPDANVPTADAGASFTLTCSNTEATLDGSASSIGSNYEYEWQDSDGNILGDSLIELAGATGVYTLLVTDTNNGCTASSTVEIFEDIDLPNTIAGSDTILTCTNDELILNGNQSSVSTGVITNYEWYDEGGNLLSTLAIADVTNPGTYTLIITGSNGCTSSDELIVDEDFEMPTIDPGTADLLTCIQTTVTLDASNSSGNAPLDFEWFDENDISISGDAMVDVMASETYTVIVTNLANGCTESETIFVDENIITPSANAGQGAFLTCDETEVTLIGSGTSQNGSVSYEWQNAGGVTVGNMPAVEVTEVGIYTLIITDDANGCTSTSTVEVLPDANLPTANAGTSFTLTCTDTEVVLDGSNSSTGMNISYEWQDENGTILGEDNTQMVADTGIYTLIVTDSNNGCSASSTVEVFENIDPPTALAGSDPTLTCDDNQVIIDGGMSSTSSGVITNFEWFDADGNLIADFAATNVTMAGVYTLVITGSNGCTASDEVEVLLDANVPEAVIGAGGLLTCETLNLDLGDASSNNGLNVSYQWTDSDGNVLGGTPTIDIAAPDIYTLLVTNLDNDCDATASLEILQDITPPIADAGIDETLTCVLLDYELGGIGTSVGAEFSYEWQDENDVIISEDINPSIADPGMYNLVVTNNANGCTTSSDVIIDQDIQSPMANAGGDGTLTCDVSEVTLDGSNSTGNNLSYEWQNESGVVISNMVSTQVAETGTFTLIVTNDQNGCTASSIATVIPDANLPMAIANPDGILTCVISQVNLDGSTSTSVSGMTSYEWRDDLGNSLSIDDNFDVNIPGIYTLVVTDDANGCSTSTNVEVLEDMIQPTADAGATQTLICGQTEATLTGIGGNGTNLSYAWLNDQGVTIGDEATITVSSTGTYVLIVTNDDNGCNASSTVDLIPDNNLPTADAGVGGMLTCENVLFTLNGNASSQGVNFEYEWQNEFGIVISTDLTFDVSNPGTYTLVVLNTDNNCSAQDQVIINQDINDPTAFADYGSAQSLDCNNNSITLDGSGSSPFGSLEFLWSTTDGNISSGTTSINPEIDEAGTYILVVTNTDNGCTSTTSITVDENISPPAIVIEDPDLITCNVLEVGIDASASSSVGDLTYIWTGNGIIAGGNTLEPTVNQSGTFTLTIIDNENGCESAASVSVDENTTPPSVSNIALGEFDCLTESVNLSGEGSSVGSNFSYLWTGNGTIDNSTTLDPTVYEPGAYTLLVTDASNGCTITETLVVAEDTNVPTSFELLVENPECFGDNGNVVISTVIGGDAPYLYSIDNGENFVPQSVFTNLDPGSYDLVVQDANGCEYAENLFISEPVEVDVNVEPSVLIQLGEGYQINALINIPLEEIDTILWSPAEGLSCTDCLNPSVDILNTSIYTVTIINENGCSDTEEIILRVEKGREVFVPNIFTPNNDGINDVLMIFADNDEVKEITTLQIFDRWGEQVFGANNFQANDPNFGWNGKFRDQELNPGVFVYWARVEFIDGFSLIVKGDVTLTR